MQVLRSTIVVVCAACVFVACGGDSPTGNNDDDGGMTREILASPAFSANIQEIFDRRRIF